MTLIIIMLGFAFGLALQCSKVNTLLFGARLTGSCTSGHVISGGMQLALSSLVFEVFVFAGFLITGKLFYKKQNNHVL